MEDPVVPHERNLYESKISREDQRTEEHGLCSLKRPVFASSSFVVCVWRQRSSDQDDYKGKKSHNETRFQSPQSCSWLVVRSNQSGPQNPNQKYWHQKTNSQTYWPREISHVMNGIIFCVCSTLAISVLQIVLKWCQKERKKIQVKKESQQNRSRWWIWYLRCREHIVEDTPERRWFESQHHSLIMFIWAALKENVKYAKTLWTSYRNMFESRISAGAMEKLLVSEKSDANVSSWSYDMEGHAKKCVERYCEVANKTTQQLYKVATPCMDDHQFKEEENGSVGELSKVCSQTVLTCLFLARIGGPHIFMVCEQTCPCSYKMDQSMWQTFSAFDLSHSS